MNSKPTTETKTITAKILISNDKQKEYLENTIILWNNKFREYSRFLFSLKKKDWGDENINKICREFFDTMTSRSVDSQNWSNVLKSFDSKKEWGKAHNAVKYNPNSNADFKEKIDKKRKELDSKNTPREKIKEELDKEISEEKKKFEQKMENLFYKIKQANQNGFKPYSDLYVPSYIEPYLISAVVGKIKSFKSNSENYKKELLEWKNKLSKFNDENKEFNELIKPKLLEFIKTHDVKNNFKYNWDKYIDFLMSFDKNSIKHEDFKTFIQLEENEKLISIHTKIKEYIENFIREGKEQFENPPTYTEADHKTHPEWPQYKKNDSYKHLIIKGQKLESKLIKEEDIKNHINKINLLVFDKEDQRKGMSFKSFNLLFDKRINENTTFYEDNGKAEILYRNKVGHKIKFDIKGVKLIRKDNEYYLYFTCEVQTNTNNRIIEMKFKDSKPNGFKLNKDKIIVFAVDMTFRGHGFNFTQKELSKNEKGYLTTRTIREGKATHNCSATSKANIDRIENLKKNKQRNATKNRYPKHLINSHFELQDQNVKRLASLIANMAANTNYKTTKKGTIYPPSDVILIENLHNMKASNKNSKSNNKGINKMAFEKMMYFLESNAKQLNIQVQMVNPAGTSQICSQCSEVGIRFDEKNGRRILRHCGKMFICKKCGYTKNADINSPENMIMQIVNKNHKDKFFGRGKKTIKELEQQKKEDQKFLDNILENSQKEVII